jgi:alpha-tubulin suppressor-like RCC1 family protein
MLCVEIYFIVDVDVGQGTFLSSILSRPASRLLGWLAGTRPPTPLPLVTNTVFSYKHTLAMSATGSVFSCGCNAQGQLGVKSSTDRVLFESIPYLQKEDIVSISAGARHRLRVFVEFAVSFCID